MKKNLLALLFGAIFGLGLGISKMTDPQVVLDFFDITGNFNPLLLFVFIAALVTTISGYHFVFKRNTPINDGKYHLPEFTSINIQLIIGAGLFGVGWGISGYCPAPILGIIIINPIEFFIFVVPMGLAFYLVKRAKI